MYVVGGFDGSRLNDVYHTAIQKSMDDSVDSLSSSTTRSNKQPTSAASGIMHSVPSDLSIHMEPVDDTSLEMED